MKNKILSLLFIFILSITLISAVPPVTTTQQFTEGYNIQIPQDNILKVNEPYLFEFHVFNISNGVPKTSGISCDLHLYDNLGLQIYYATDSSVDVYGDYTFNVTKGNFSKVNNYYYYIRCNSSTMGGFAESILFINDYGIILSDSQGMLSIGILISILFIMLFFGWLSFKFIDKNETFGFGLFFLVISLILSLYALFLGYILSRDYLFTSISDVQEKIFISGLLGLSAIMLIAFTFLIVKVVNQLKVKNTEKKYGKGYNQKSKTYDY